MLRLGKFRKWYVHICVLFGPKHSKLWDFLERAVDRAGKNLLMV